MAQRAGPTGSAAMPRLARWLGLAGLIPPVLLAAMIIGGPPEYKRAATGLAISYSGLILSFIGGTWWGLAAQAGERAPPRLWLAAVVPSLVVFASLGASSAWRSTGPGLLVIGAALIAALGIDFRLAANGLCPPGWLRLRTPLSLGLGALCMIVASVAP